MRKVKKKSEKKSVDGWRPHELDRNASAFDFAPALAPRGRGSQHFKYLQRYRFRSTIVLSLSKKLFRIKFMA
jgi:hypothetical protein